ncbi:hypothetical protein D0T84_14195 [Dysgonomonas sp. 521]|uniref:PCMD domain-containing protein n=1 Tax=Dysgonomonas sp. 521 TaxID=2302932 RepID=UPI0013D82B0C|nr:PCMD domain-containing protein [Dysgonomonas sp. 521]NDV96054.1 hypothetical protein [Dysgonomonas sp. 521]
MNKRILNCVLLLFSLALFTACSDDDDKSSKAQITKMTFEDAIVITQPEIDGTNITFYVNPDATSEELSKLVPTIEISAKASIDPASGTAVDFSEGSAKFTVTAEDDTQVIYTVNCMKFNDTGSSILRMTFDDPIVVKQPVIDGTNIIFYVKGTAVGEDMEKLIPTIEISKDAAIDPASGSEVDFSDGIVKFTVTGKDGAETIYTAICVKSSNVESAIISMTFDNPVVTQQPVINGTDIVFFIADDATLSDIQELVPTINISEKATVDPAPGTAVDFSNGSVEFTVTAGDGTTKTIYNVSFWQNKYGFEDWIVENPQASESLFFYAPVGGWTSSNTGAAYLKGMGYTTQVAVTKTDDAHSGTGAARIETLDTKGGNIFGIRIPKVTTGTLYTGKFITDTKNTLNSTKFGAVYNKKPMTVKGYYKYTPGEVFYRCPDTKKINETVVEDGTIDECSINAILYEIETDADYLTGVDAYKSDKLVAIGQLQDGTAKAQYTQFSIDMEYKADKQYDPAKKYRFAIICSSSKYGDTFSGAPGSVLYIDDIEIISE